MTTKRTVLSSKPVVANIGVSAFAMDLAAQKVKVVQILWKPPKQNEKMTKLLESLM